MMMIMIQPCILAIVIARIFSGVHFFTQILGVLNTRAKTAKLSTPTLQLSPAQQKISSKNLLLCLGRCTRILHL